MIETSLSHELPQPFAAEKGSRMTVTIPLQGSIELGKRLDAVPAEALERAWSAVGGGQVEALEDPPANTVKVRVYV